MSRRPPKRRPATRRRTKSDQKDRPVWRRRLVLGAWMFAGLAIVARAGQVQILQGSAWQDFADRQHQRTTAVPAPRGAVTDRNGVIVAMSQERVKVNVAPREVANADTTVALLTEVLGLSESAARSAVTADKPWVVLRGDYPASVRGRLRGILGVHLERRSRRFYPNGSLGTSLLGAIQEGEASGGIEQSFDSLLSGVAGQEIEARDASTLR